MVRSMERTTSATRHNTDSKDGVNEVVFETVTNGTIGTVTSIAQGGWPCSTRLRSTISDRWRCMNPPPVLRCTWAQLIDLNR